jgi:hypothetical protein
MSDAYSSQLDVERSLMKERGLAPEPRAPVRDRPDIAYKPAPPRVGSQQEYDALVPGTDFLDSQGNTRTKPHTVTDEESYETVPEGADFLDPQGNLRTKPQYEGVDFTTHTLFDMAVNEREQRRALERGYPGAEIRSDPRGFYVQEPDGTRRRPKSAFDESQSLGQQWKAAGAGMGGGFFPTVGAIGGEIVGGLAGGLPGAVGGAAAGGAAGQGFNDAIMALAGVYDRSVGEEATELGASGAMAGAGTAVGRGIAAIAPRMRGAKVGLPGFAAKFLGADPEGLQTAITLGERGGQGERESSNWLLRMLGVTEPGTMAPLSGWAKGAPRLQNIHEIFDPAFHTEKPLLQSATRHYEREAGNILEQLGERPEGSISSPTAAVSTERAGTAILTRAREAAIEQDARLAAAHAARRETAIGEALGRAVGQAGEHSARIETLRQAEVAARKAAEDLIDAGFQDIHRDIDGATKVAKAGGNSGDLWQAVGEKLKAMKQGIAARARKMYDEANALAGDHLPDISGLPERAAQFLSELPEGFENRYPSIVKQIRDLAGVQKLDEHGVPTGEWEKEPVTPTFGQLHNLRSILRSNYNHLDLTPDVKQGTFRFFANRVDEILHDPGAVPELQEAARALRQADDFYRDAIRPLTDKHVQAVVSGLESGMPADPQNLFDTLIREGRSDLTRTVARLVGPNLWAGIKAADVQSMLDLSRTLVPGQIDGRAFARQVLERHRNNMLEAVHGREASAKLIEQAQRIEMLDGRLELPIRHGYPVTEVISRAHAAANAVKAVAKQDPLGMLKREMGGIEAAAKKESAELRAKRLAGPFGFLLKPTTGAAEAVNRILGSEDLILAAAARFGEDSPEFEMLRQVHAQRILQGTLEPSEELAKISPEVQRVMFPGVMLDQMQQLAKEMDFLMSTRGTQGEAKSMAAVSKVEHPWASILGRGGTVAHVLTAPTKVVPGADAVGRAMLGGYYGLVRKLATSPAFLRWVQKGLDGDPVAREAVRRQVQKALQRGGAGVGEVLEQTQEPNLELTE